MNNKGQALVIFVLLLPIIIMLFALVADIGSLTIAKHKIETEVKDTIEYGLKNIDEPDIKNKINNLLQQNSKGINQVSINNETIKIKVTYEQQSMFTFVFNNKSKIEITYTGYIENGRIKIVKG